MSIRAFHDGDGIIVSARGPGQLYLLSYSSNQQVVNHAGSTHTKAGTTTRDITRFIISHSYTFEKFAFCWSGAGECVCAIGQSLTRVPVGRSWNEATTIAWGGNSFGTANVQEEANRAVLRDNQITCFIIPDNLL